MSANLNAISSPQLLKETVRAQRYPNSQVERETIAAADRAADAVVSRHANLMQADARERIEYGASLVSAAEELHQVMVDDVRVELSLGTAPSVLAPVYERIEADMKKAIAELRQEAARCDLLADRVEDPAADYERLIERLPALRRGIQW